VTVIVGGVNVEPSGSVTDAPDVTVAANDLVCASAEADDTATAPVLSVETGTNEAATDNGAADEAAADESGVAEAALCGSSDAELTATFGCPLSAAALAPTADTAPAPTIVAKMADE
jgi:hypothetical protein